MAQPVALKAIARSKAHDAIASEYADERRERQSICPLLVTYDPVPAHVIAAIIFDLDTCLAAADEGGAVYPRTETNAKHYIADLSELYTLIRNA